MTVSRTSPTNSSETPNGRRTAEVRRFVGGGDDARTSPFRSKHRPHRAGAYVVLTATYHDDLGYLSHVPILYLALAVIGVPLAAAGAGWLVAGREPSAIARRAIE